MQMLTIESRISEDQQIQAIQNAIQGLKNLPPHHKTVVTEAAINQLDRSLKAMEEPLKVKPQARIIAINSAANFSTPQVLKKGTAKEVALAMDKIKTICHLVSEPHQIKVIRQEARESNEWINREELFAK